MFQGDKSRESFHSIGQFSKAERPKCAIFQKTRTRLQNPLRNGIHTPKFELRPPDGADEKATAYRAALKELGKKHGVKPPFYNKKKYPFNVLNWYKKTFGVGLLTDAMLLRLSTCPDTDKTIVLVLTVFARRDLKQSPKVTDKTLALALFPCWQIRNNANWVF
ncbi:ORF95-like protein [Bufonid herpesvirus 1]|uniref:ORF95-like protein n=1 Tax=Bufonid herpesvirus 1 TaxID=2282206 RepID=UPI000EB6F648|nr:ORF95-like protein [Bufonid herpesvirus 1]AXF48534.1 ORF95-like protein [Bufonid herpesvirus 1]